ncbi:MAG: LPS-assembly protein LptD [Sphingobacteriales bacterium]|nr:MAG: LPS-assembly protein LptD [Sphingobacteriales bacterium]TAF81554.1 MAG: LPS-assembly protein LptD [Sphingobacteriales bacterium]
MKFNKLFFIYCVLLFIAVAISADAYAQQKKTKTISVKPITKNIKDTVLTDTLVKKSKKSDIDDEITITAEDSILYKNNVMYVYKKGRVVYGEKQIDAGYITLNQNSKTVFAKGTVDSLGKFSGLPIIKDPKDGMLTADSLLYNFNTSRGKIFQVYTEQQGGFITGGTIKKQKNSEVHLKKVIYSSCNLPSPHQHFGIIITKGIATEKQIITGPAYLMIEGVPLPFVLPFGFFPKPDKRSSGIILPQFGEDATLGFFLRDFGYYLGFNDYWDLTLKGGVYTKSSYEANAQSSYTKRYKYNGNVFLSYSSKRFGIEGTAGYKPAQDFSIRWSHSQNPNAHPGTSFSASVNAATATNFRNNATGNINITQITQNNLQSSIAYSKTFANSPFSLSSSFSHSQEISRRQISLGLPNLNFNMTTLNPLDNKDRTGAQKWYQRIAIGYNMNANNQLNIADSLLFTKKAISQIRNGVEHVIPITLSSTVLKFFQISQSVNYSEKWYFQTIRKGFLTRPTNTGLKDSSTLDTIAGFRRASEYRVSTSVSTKFYGMVNFKKGKLMAIRHVVTPNVGLAYTPDFGAAKYGYYQSVQVNQRGDQQKYSIFENSMYGGPGIGRQAGISFGVDNTIELKVRNSKDTTGKEATKKIPVIQGLSISGFYNLAADSFKLSRSLAFSGRTFFTEKIGLNFGGSLDPYIFQKQEINGRVVGKSIDRYTWLDGKFPALTSFNFSFDYKFNSEGQNKKTNNPPNPNNTGLFDKVSPEQAQLLRQMSANENAFVDFKIPWSLYMQYGFNYQNNRNNQNIVQTLGFSGDFSLTPKWKVSFNSGYDFELKKMSFTSFSINRDLHCWDLAIQWVPFGLFQSYSIDLRVRSSILQDLKLSKRRNFYDAR